MDRPSIQSIYPFLASHRSFVEKLNSKQTVAPSTANSPSSAAIPEADDDVILIEREIPIIDLCTPSVPSRQSTQPLAEFFDRVNQYYNNVGTSTTPKKENNNHLVNKSVGKPLVMCTICLKSAIGRKPHATACGHVFCEHCIRRSMIAKKQCPTCKKFICAVNPLYI